MIFFLSLKLNSDSSSDSDAEDPYIQFQTKEDVYPDQAIFDHLSREEANR